jgi:toxin ParE1/3/4
MPNTHKVIISKYAEEDIKEIINYYLTIDSAFAESLLSSFEARILELRAFPDRGRIVPELEKQGITNYRELIEGNYRIVYRVSPENVAILSMIDSRRNLEDLLLIKLMR